MQRAGVSDALPEPDFEQLFHLVPSPLVVLMPDFTIVHSNQARLESTATTFEATVGRNLFDVFPANPGDPEADGTWHEGNYRSRPS